MMIRRFGEGVLVLMPDGVVALSGVTGEELWSYRDRGQELTIEVTGNGDYVTLYNRDENETVVLAKAAGEVMHIYDINLDEIDYTHTFGPDSLRPALHGITGDAWIVRWEDSVNSYDLSTGEPLWSVPDVPNCSDVGQVGDLSVRNEVVVAATTCFEHPEDKESVAWTVGWDFTSELVGLSPETGEELWRVEHSIGRMPIDSLDRGIASRPGGLIYVDYPESYDLGISLIDIDAGEATYLEGQSLLWTSPDGSRLGLWDTETGEYRIQDRSGHVERTLDREIVSMGEDMVTDGRRVGLEGGVLYLGDEMEDASSPEGFARFEGFDGSVTFTWDEAESLSVTDALSVPGAVAVAYRADGEPGVMGLR